MIDSKSNLTFYTDLKYESAIRIIFRSEYFSIRILLLWCYHAYYIMIIYYNPSEKINFRANAKTFLPLYLHVARSVRYIAHKSFMMHKNRMTARIDRNVKPTLTQKWSHLSERNKNATCCSRKKEILCNPLVIFLDNLTCATVQSIISVNIAILFGSTNTANTAAAAFLPKTSKTDEYNLYVIITLKNKNILAGHKMNA